MPAVIFSGSDVKTLKDNINVNDNITVLTGDTDDPTSVAKSANQGSLYFRSGTDELYKKDDNGSSTNWSLVSAATVPNSDIFLHTGNGHGSTNTVIRRFTTAAINTGSAMTLTQSATLGDIITINQDGMYSIVYSDYYSGGNGNTGVSLNSAQLTTAVQNITVTDRLLHTGTLTGQVYEVSGVFRLSASDVIRPHTDGNNNGADNQVRFRVIHLGA